MPSTELDHLLLAVPDLARGCAEFAARTGVTPAPGGTHAGFGTRNALVSLGPGLYLELIAPDPDHPVTRSPFAALIGATAALRTVAVRTDDLAAFARAARDTGAEAEAPLRMGRTRPDGVRLDWSVLFVPHAGFGPLVPFAIDWQGSPHPSASSPSGCTLHSLVARDPDAARLQSLYTALGITLPVEPGAAGFAAILDTPRGPVAL